MQVLIELFSRYQYPEKSIHDKLLPIVRILHPGDKLQLLREGQEQKDLYIMREGMGRMYYIDENGEKITASFSQPGELLAQLDSFFLQRPAVANLEVYSEGSFYLIEFTHFKALFMNDPLFAWTFLRMVGVEFMNLLMQKLHTKPAEKRLLKLMEHHINLFLFASAKDVAKFLGIHEKTIERIRNQFLKNLK
ncbi:cAMP-binding domain of CRP or a regulatory subunit of cAMP-dependent protein kinases [bacterium A37T11]|nr:cAMP-binding domain of CRP or a regulatory subunit of cAMP-dependent protein kinases [bacterium A37T11]